MQCQWQLNDVAATALTKNARRVGQEYALSMSWDTAENSFSAHEIAAALQIHHTTVLEANPKLHDTGVFNIVPHDYGCHVRATWDGVVRLGVTRQQKRIGAPGRRVVDFEAAKQKKSTRVVDKESTTKDRSFRSQPSAEEGRPRKGSQYAKATRSPKGNPIGDALNDIDDEIRD